MQKEKIMHNAQSLLETAKLNVSNNDVYGPIPKESNEMKYMK